MGKVSYKRDIDSQIAKVREQGYKEIEKAPRGFTGDKNRYFVKSLSGVLNIYAIVNAYGVLSNYFELEKGPFKKMIKELSDITTMYGEYNERIRWELEKYRRKTTGNEEHQKILTLTKRNNKLLERMSKKHLAFLRKYSEFNQFCVRYTFTPEGTLLTWFVFGQTMTKGDCGLFFKFCRAVLDNHNVYVEIRGVSKGTGLKYNLDVRDRVMKSYEKRKRDCRRILEELDICSSPHKKARELAKEFRVSSVLVEKVIEGTTTLTNFILSVVYYDVFETTENQHLEYLRKMLRTKNPTRN